MNSWHRGRIGYRSLLYNVGVVGHDNVDLHMDGLDTVGLDVVSLGVVHLDVVRRSLVGLGILGLNVVGLDVVGLGVVHLDVVGRSIVGLNVVCLAMVDHGIINTMLEMLSPVWIPTDIVHLPPLTTVQVNGLCVLQPKIVFNGFHPF